MPFGNKFIGDRIRSLQVNFSIVYRTHGIKGERMDDWDKNQAANLKKAIADSQSKDDIFQERQKLKRQFGPGLWKEVKERVGERSSTHNTEMKQDVLEVNPTPSDTLEVGASVKGAKVSLKAKFENDLGPLEWYVHTVPSSSPNPSGKLFLQVDQEGNVGFGEIENSTTTLDADGVAKHLLGALLGKVKSRL